MLLFEGVKSGSSSHVRVKSPVSLFAPHEEGLTLALPLESVTVKKVELVMT